MSRLIWLHPSAIDEIDAAVDWYYERSQRAAAAFLDEFDVVMARISEHPEQFPQYELAIRRASFRRFPYAAIFHERADHIELIAVAHSRRRPGYWRNRI